MKKLIGINFNIWSCKSKACSFLLHRLLNFQMIAFKLSFFFQVSDLSNKLYKLSLKGLIQSSKLLVAKNHSLLIAEVARYKNSLLIARFVRYLLQKLLVEKITYNLLLKVAVAKNYSSMVNKKTRELMFM